MRLFTAVYPPPDALDHLDLALGALRDPVTVPTGPGLRWVLPPQRHVTLAFHGEVPDGALPGYVEALGAMTASIAPFEVALAGGGSFGGRTLWAGIGTGLVGLRALAAATGEAAAQAGIAAQDRAGGRPHLTLARSSAARTPRRGPTNRRGTRRGADDVTPLTSWAHALTVYRGPRWQVDTVHVVASELGAGRSGGPLHTDLARVPLGEPGDGGTPRRDSDPFGLLGP